MKRIDFGISTLAAALSTRSAGELPTVVVQQLQD
jgi:hypothetical protein